MADYATSLRTIIAEVAEKNKQTAKGGFRCNPCGREAVYRVINRDDYDVCQACSDEFDKHLLYNIDEEGMVKVDWQFAPGRPIDEFAFPDAVGDPSALASNVCAFWFNNDNEHANSRELQNILTPNEEDRDDYEHRFYLYVKNILAWMPLQMNKNSIVLICCDKASSQFGTTLHVNVNTKIIQDLPMFEDIESESDDDIEAKPGPA